MHSKLSRRGILSLAVSIAAIALTGCGGGGGGGRVGPITLPTPIPGPPEAPLSAQFTRLKAGEKVKIVAFGTSLTAGGAWVTGMTKWFQAQYPGQVTVVNSGGFGKNSDWGTGVLQSKVLGQNPDIVIIEFSFNDAVHHSSVSLHGCKANLNKIVTSVLAQNPNAAIILQTMTAPWDAINLGVTPASDRPNLEGYNNVYRDYAKAVNLPLVDNYKTFAALLKADPDNYHKLVPDGAHPGTTTSLNVIWGNLQTLMEKAQAATS